ncbi:hypothetical protein O181_003060 [Austropuccinia psidii MF-1]|uniref:Uncharacterized protein n=1 Tax=Austropuccinia psidii MF-1 TaxID=1389203 RepID=A0A9Q3GDH5_9BASI|nr:hypothetical protein [Austropuccinia psidii MF-1]
MTPAQKPAMALNLSSNPSPKTFPAILGKVRFYGPGPSQWAQAIWVRKWSIAILYGPMDPLEFWHMGSFWPWGGSSSPHGPQTVGRANDQKGPKIPLITITSKRAMAMAWTQNPQVGPNCRPSFKYNGDKPPLWMMPNSK